MVARGTVVFSFFLGFGYVFDVCVNFVIERDLYMGLCTLLGLWKSIILGFCEWTLILTVL